MEAKWFVDKLFAIVHGLKRQTRSQIVFIPKRYSDASDYVMDRFVTATKMSVVGY